MTGRRTQHLPLFRPQTRSASLRAVELAVREQASAVVVRLRAHYASLGAFEWAARTRSAVWAFEIGRSCLLGGVGAFQMGLSSPAAWLRWPTTWLFRSTPEPWGRSALEMVRARTVVAAEIASRTMSFSGRLLSASAFALSNFAP